MFSYTAYSKPETFKEDLCIWLLLDRIACTGDWSLKMLFHTHKLHFPFKPGTFSLLRDTRLQKLTQESQWAQMRGLSVTYQGKAAVSTVSSTALGQPSTFYLHFLPFPLRSALPSQQDSSSSGSLLLDRQWAAQQSPALNWGPTVLL